MLNFSRLRSRRLSLRTLLIVPFVVQLLIAIAIVALIASFQGRRAVVATIDQLQRGIAERISNQVFHYLEAAHTATQLSADAIALGHLKLDDKDEQRRYLFKQIQQFHTLGYTAITTEAGSYVGLSRIGLDGTEILLDWYGETGQFEKWQLDAAGNPVKLWEARDNYDHRTRPWYREAVDRGDAVWTDLFGYHGSGKLVISANRPLFDAAGDVLGVVSTDLRLDQISQFLTALEISANGEAFIVDDRGNLIGASEREPALNKEFSPLKAVDSSLLFVSTVSAELFDRHEGRLPEPPTNLTLEIAGERNRVYTLQHSDLRGLNWTIVVVVPENDFMQPIVTMSHQVTYLSLLAFGLAIGVSIATAHNIAAPIHSLAQASHALAHHFDRGEQAEMPNVKPQTIHELHLLATAFAQMSVRLQSSFQQLETINYELEERVQARTRELQQANGELQRLASIDGLTQIANRRYFDEYVAVCWNEARDRGTPLAIVLCDIDHFKQFNDTYGHQAGDDCLQRVAQTMEAAVMHAATSPVGGREALVARYGGEEFVVVLPEMGQEQARSVVEAVQTSLRQLAIPHARSSAAKIVTLSLGIAVMTPEAIATPAQMLEAADRALYATKTGGRNGYCFAPPLDAQERVSRLSEPIEPIKTTTTGVTTGMATSTTAGITAGTTTGDRVNSTCEA